MNSEHHLSCTCFPDGGMSLLKHPSAAMSKLIQSAEKGSMRAVGTDKALQKPVMAFIIQRHDLDSLQLAMRQALRKAACRVFALQVTQLVVTVISSACDTYEWAISNQSDELP